MLRKSPKTTFYIYILECRDGTYYVGYTPDIVKRVELHKQGKGSRYTKTRCPVKLVWNRKFNCFKSAFREEK